MSRNLTSDGLVQAESSRWHSRVMFYTMFRTRTSWQWWWGTTRGDVVCLIVQRCLAGVRGCYVHTYPSKQNCTGQVLAIWTLNLSMIEVWCYFRFFLHFFHWICDFSIDNHTMVTLWKALTKTREMVHQHEKNISKNKLLVAVEVQTYMNC